MGTSESGDLKGRLPTWTGNVLLETPLLKPIPSGRQPRKPQPRRVTIIVLTHIRHDMQDSFSHKPILAGACLHMGVVSYQGFHQKLINY